MGRKLFDLNGRAYCSIAIKNIPSNRILPLQRELKACMNSPGKMAPIATPKSNCLKITYSMDPTSNRVSVIKNSLEWLMQNRQDIFYVDYSELNIRSIVDAFNLEDFSTFTLKNEPKTDCYDVF